MTIHIFLAHAAADGAFAQKISGVLRQNGLDTWLPSPETTEGEFLERLAASSHLLATLSPAALQDELFLAALEFARQNKLERIALRLAAVELPPQLAGVLPLDFSSEEVYQDSLETLLADLHASQGDTQPVLPEEVLKALYSDNPLIRKNAIEALGAYRHAEESLRLRALDELAALVFREREGHLKTLIQLTLKSFDEAESQAGDVRKTEPRLPSKEELAQRAGEKGVLVENLPPVTLARRAPAYQSLADAPRWFVVITGMSFLLGAVLAWATGQGETLAIIWGVGVFLAQFNVVIRDGGRYVWDGTGALFGNLTVGLLLGGALGLFLLARVETLTMAWFLGIWAVVGGLSALIGWLSSLRFAV